MIEPAYLDLIEAFGPLSGMHAALDRINCGTPCGFIARFEGRSVKQVHDALAAAADRFPILRSRLMWSGDRPYLHLDACPSLNAGGEGASLRFTAACGALWTKRLVQAGEDTWLTCIFAHAAADGLSMLRLLHALEAQCYEVQAAVPAAPARAATKRPPGPYWLSQFLLDRMRAYAEIDRAECGEIGISVVRIPAGFAEGVIDHARSVYGGFAPHLAAAAVLSVSEQGQNRRPVLLNLPIARSDLERFGGFGFDVGSLITAVSVPPLADVKSLSRHLSSRLRRMREMDWDQGLDRLIGHNARRHAFFAATRARSQPDPSIVVSWKGAVELGGGGLRDVACFAAAPTAHVSAHTDLLGLSISLTSPHPPATRAALLESIAHHLGARVQATAIDLVSGQPLAST